MHVLIIPSWYGFEACGPVGSFFREQARSLTQFYSDQVRVGMIYPFTHSLPELAKRRFRGGCAKLGVRDEGGYLLLYQVGGVHLPLSLPRLSSRVWASHVSRLYREYARAYGPPDVILAQSAMWAGWSARILKQEFGVPYVLYEHRGRFLSGVNMRKRLSVPARAREAAEAFNDADLVATVSRAMAGAILDLPRIHPRDIEIIPNMVDLGLFSPPPFQETKRQRRSRFLSVGRLVPEKGFPALIAAFSAAVAQKPDLTLDIVGDGPEKARLISIARGLGLGSSIHFAGAQSRKSVAEAMRAADVFILASELESFGLVFAEAQACGLPIIATNVGGIPEVLSTGAGELVEVGDVTSMTEAILTAASDDYAYSPEYVVEFAVRRYSPEAVSTRLLDILLRAVRRPPSSAQNAAEEYDKLPA